MNHEFCFPSSEAYEEECYLKGKIAKILSGNTTTRTKLSQLKECERTAMTLLGKSQAAYYIRKLQQKRREFYLRLAVSPFFCTYFALAIYRADYFIRPDKTHLPFPYLPVPDPLILFLIFPLLAFLYFFIRFLLSEHS